MRDVVAFSALFNLFDKSIKILLETSHWDLYEHERAKFALDS